MDEITNEAKEFFNKRKVELIKILEAFESLEKTQEWDTLKELYFNKTLESIKRQLLVEASSPLVDIHKVYRLQGELSWAKRFNNINEFIESLKRELEEISKKIK